MNKPLPNITWADMIDVCKACDQECPFTGCGPGVDYGCLPSAGDMVEHARLHNEMVSCHSDETKPCRGIAKFLKKNGFDIKNMKVRPQQEIF